MLGHPPAGLTVNDSQLFPGPLQIVTAREPHLLRCAAQNEPASWPYGCFNSEPKKEKSYPEFIMETQEQQHAFGKVVVYEGGRLERAKGFEP